jgi:hypothetical protein
MKYKNGSLDPVLYFRQYEPEIIPKIDLLSVWFVCLAAGTCAVYINTNIWHIILGIGIDDKITFILHYIGLMSCIIFQVSMMLIGLEMDPDNKYIFYLLSSLSWQVNYNCYLIMFMKQSGAWFGRLYVKISVIIIILTNVAICTDTYYYMKKCSDSNEDIAYISVQFDYSVTIGISVVEFIYNSVTIYKIVKAATRANSQALIFLIIKLVSVLFFFFLADIAVTIIYGLVNEFYSVSLCAYLIALKLQTEYFCLSKIRQCIIIVQSYENSHSQLH